MITFMETNQIIQDPNIWAGLNRPGIAVEEADVVIFGIPYDGAVQFRSGARNAPKALREITYTISPTTEDLECWIWAMWIAAITILSFVRWRILLAIASKRGNSSS